MSKPEPIEVKVVNHPKPTRYELRGAYRSVVLTAANPYQQLVGPDPLRKHITAGPLGANPIVVCGSISQASDTNNAVNPVTQPNGRYVPANSQEFQIEGQQEVWIVASAFPTIVGYTIVREVPDNG